jgi:hypothetical protein
MKEKNTRQPPAISTIAFGAVILLLGGWLFFRHFRIDVEFTSAAPNSSVPVIETAPSAQNSASSASIASQDGLEKPDPALVAAKQGNLRVSNRSSHALRVALLSRQKDTNAKTGTTEAGFALPAHWDFAPSEGSEKGLIVSLPNRKIQLKRGDVVVAFAQDGSQRYWGPFVVGETDRPTWNAQAGEWELTLDE